MRNAGCAFVHQRKHVECKNTMVENAKSAKQLCARHALVTKSCLQNANYRQLYQTKNVERKKHDGGKCKTSLCKTCRNAEISKTIGTKKRNAPSAQCRNIQNALEGRQPKMQTVFASGSISCETIKTQTYESSNAQKRRTGQPQP